MTVSILVITLLMAYTLVFAIQEEKLPEFLNKKIQKIRENKEVFDQLFGCSFCLGFWTGVVSYLLIQSTHLYLVQGDWRLLFFTPFLGLSSSASSYILNQITMIGASVEELPPELQAQLEQHFENEEIKRELYLQDFPSDDTFGDDGFCEDCHCMEEKASSPNKTDKDFKN